MDLSDEVVHPRVPLTDCLDSFSHPEEVQGFYSTALKARTTAIKELLPALLTHTKALALQVAEQALSALATLLLDKEVLGRNACEFCHLHSIVS
ncbi:putative ubiquitinyl hydrolase 1 [Helianthus annuus]|nr:putative ubiquitinyl hydrolase 1 [Helianthus annuus]